MELEEFDYTIKHVPGVMNTAADTLSRSSSASKSQPTSYFEEKIYALTSNFTEQLIEEQGKDPVISNAIQCLQSNELITKGRLKRVQKNLRLEDHILKKSGRSVIPSTLRNFVVSNLHNVAHFGTDKTYHTRC